MELIKKSGDYVIYQKRSKRYAVKNADHKWVNGDEKTNVLLAEKLIKVAPPKKKEEKPAEETPAAEDAPAEDSKE